MRDFVNAAFREIGVTLEWRGRRVDEQGVDVASGTVRVEVDRRYSRPTDVETLLGDPTTAREKLGWTPQITFGEIVTLMSAEVMENDLQLARRDALVKEAGYRAFDYGPSSLGNQLVNCHVDVSSNLTKEDRGKVSPGSMPITSRRFALSSSRLSPWLWAPGRPGT